MKSFCLCMSALSLAMVLTYIAVPLEPAGPAWLVGLGGWLCALGANMKLKQRAETRLLGKEGRK